MRAIRRTPALAGASLWLLVSSVATAAGPARPNPNPWVQTNVTDGVTVAVRDVPGSDVREVRAESLIPAPPARVFSALMDFERYADFMPYVQEARIVRRLDAASFFGYQLIDPPLVSARDYTLRYVVEQDAASQYYRLSWSEANEQGPAPRDGVVRITICQGYWSLEPEASGQATRAVYWLYTHPGGSIPAWMANKANTSSLPDLHAALRQRSLDARWKRP